MTDRMRYLLLAGFGAILLGCAARRAILYDSFHPIEAFHTFLFERPQKHPPRGIWRNARSVQSPAKFELPQTDIFFAEYGTHSRFMEIRTNATYQTILRMHFGAILWDEGTWHVTETGDILMLSHIRFHNLYSDDHWYIMVDSNILADLSTIKTNIQDFLQLSSSNTYTLAEAEDIRRYSTCYDTNKTFSAFTGYDWKPVRRDSLDDFLTQIDTYLASHEKNVFRLRPVTYRSYVFLIDLDSHFFSPEEQLTKLKKDVDALRKKEIPSYIYVALTPEMFEAETGRSEPFKYLR